MRGATGELVREIMGRLFQSTHPMRGATVPLQGGACCQSYFNPRTPCGVRRINSTSTRHGWDFNPRTPCGVRLGQNLDKSEDDTISIHAPHAGCDLHGLPNRQGRPHFNPRTPCGVRLHSRGKTAQFVTFQSTHPMRGATTLQFNAALGMVAFQSTHPMRGATELNTAFVELCRISIHAPHAGCDFPSCSRRYSLSSFQSTHPMRGATETLMTRQPVWGYFNPRTPCGVRLAAGGMFDDVPSDFNPRTPCGVRQNVFYGGIIQRGISIHAPHAGCDLIQSPSEDLRRISIHAPHAGCDGAGISAPQRSKNFNPRTPCGVRRPVRRASSLGLGFQSTHPMRGAT